MLCMFLLSPTFWHDLIAQTPTRVIALAGVITVVVQLVKTLFPSFVSGKVAVVLNVAASVAAVCVGLNPAHFWSETTLGQVLMVAAAAAGVHGTAKTLSGNRWTAAFPPPVALDPAEMSGRFTGDVPVRPPVAAVGDYSYGNKLNTTSTDPQINLNGARPKPPL